MKAHKLLIMLGVGLALGFGPVAPAGAATITVDERTCTLVHAITAANTDTATSGCTAGRGADTIELTADVTLTAVDNINPTFGGATGLPVITTAITINGNGHTIQRDPRLFSAAAGGDGMDPCSGTGAKFRIFDVAASGNLSLNEVTVKNGCGAGVAVGILNAGTLTLTNSTVAQNTASVSSRSATSLGPVTLVTDAFECGSARDLPVAILGSASFDATTVDVSTVTLTRSGSSSVSALAKSQIQNVNGDSFADRVVYFKSTDIGAAIGCPLAKGAAVPVTVSGKTSSGIPFSGSDTIHTTK